MYNNKTKSSQTIDIKYTNINYLRIKKTIAGTALYE